MRLRLTAGFAKLRGRLRSGVGRSRTHGSRTSRNQTQRPRCDSAPNSAQLWRHLREQMSTEPQEETEMVAAQVAAVVEPVATAAGIEGWETGMAPG